MPPKKQENPNSLSNLKGPWTKGSSGNPKGRRPGESFSEIMVRELEKAWDPAALKKQAEKRVPPTNKERIVSQFVARAASGDLQAFVELMNRTEGKVPDKLLSQVEHAVKVVPWDDEENEAVVYVEDQNKSDRGETERMKSYRPGDVAALPDMYPPAEEQAKGLDQTGVVDAEYTVQDPEAAR